MSVRTLQEFLASSKEKDVGSDAFELERRLDIELADLPAGMPAVDVVALDEALEKLKQQEPVIAQLVILRYFAGMTMAQAASALNISRVTAHRYWVYARAWLYQQLGEGGAPR